jgi:hypothetical protein
VFKTCFSFRGVRTWAVSGRRADRAMQGIHDGARAGADRRAAAVNLKSKGPLSPTADRGRIRSAPLWAPSLWRYKKISKELRRQTRPVLR